MRSWTRAGNNKHPVTVVLTCFMLLGFIQPAFSSDFSQNISEQDLRAQFVFQADEQLKYSQCEDKTAYTCTYVWGSESSKDAKRLSMGLAPQGHKLQLVYVQARSQKDFQRVISSYSDAVPVEDLGENAVWSERRKQLSMITGEALIVHIHIEQAGESDARDKAISIAQGLLKKL